MLKQKLNKIVSRIMIIAVVTMGLFFVSADQAQTRARNSDDRALSEYSRKDFNYVDAKILAGTYYWVPQATPPKSVVRGAPGASGKIVCRSKDDRKNYASYGSLWVGWYDGAKCVSSYGGSAQRSADSIEFLAPDEGSAVTWVEFVGGYRDQLPAQTLGGGYNTYSKSDQIMCSQQGFVGWLEFADSSGRGKYCNISGTSSLSGQDKIYVLTGEMTGLYKVIEK